MNRDLYKVIVNKLNELDKQLENDEFTVMKNRVIEIAKQLHRAKLLSSSRGAEIVDFINNRFCYRFYEQYLLRELHDMYVKLSSAIDLDGSLLICSSISLEDKYNEVLSRVQDNDLKKMVLTRAKQLGMVIDVVTECSATVARALYKITDNIVFEFPLFTISQS